VEIKSRVVSEDSGFESGGLVDLVCGYEEVIEGEEAPALKLERGDAIEGDENLSKVIKYFDDKFKKLKLVPVLQLSKDSFIIVRVSEDTIRDVSYILSSQ
jgi:hypothetical protein